MIKKVCVINNYNYAQFLSDCLNSVLNQSLPFDKVVIVDDGSTDNSIEIIKNFCKNNSNLFPIFKANGGQLSCFNVASVYVDDESQVFFLDSDDVYPKDYLELIMNKLGGDMFDFVYTSGKHFSNIADIALTALSNDHADILWNKTSAIVRQQSIWIGDITSSLSVSGRIYKSILPYPYPEDWRSRADDLIIYGASIIGAKKLSIPSLSIGYRRHNQSDSSINHEAYLSQDQQLRRGQNIERMFDHFCAKFQLKRNPDFTEIMTDYDNLDLVSKQILNARRFEFFSWENLNQGTYNFITGFDSREVEDYIRKGAARLRINVICKDAVINGKQGLMVIHISDSHLSSISPQL
jgi:glycosyltransferase involved in cell wall biosynthesis